MYPVCCTHVPWLYLYWAKPRPYLLVMWLYLHGVMIQLLLIPVSSLLWCVCMYVFRTTVSWRRLISPAISEKDVRRLILLSLHCSRCWGRAPMERYSMASLPLCSLYLYTLYIFQNLKAMTEITKSRYIYFLVNVGFLQSTWSSKT